MALLPTVINDPHHRHPFIVLQSSIAQSSLPILRQLLLQSSKARNTRAAPYNLVFGLLYPPSTLLDEDELSEDIKLHDWTSRIPAYDDSWSSVQSDILSAIKEVPTSRLLNVVIDSVDTLLSDIGSLSKTYTFLRDVLSLIRERTTPSRLILHVVQPSELTSTLTQTAFSPSLAHLIAHPPALIVQLATEYLTPPPPASPAAKFWSVFLPISERGYDTERLVFGSNGEGSGDPSEIVVELVLRGADGSGRKRGVERVLEGWSSTRGPCDLTALDHLSPLRVKQANIEAAPPDPTQNASFNLTLTSLQQESRAKVPLPYAHEGQPLPSSTTGAIFYDPDSADDIDDDDPDEDLDI